MENGWKCSQEWFPRTPKERAEGRWMNGSQGVEKETGLGKRIADKERRQEAIQSSGAPFTSELYWMLAKASKKC